MISLVNEKYNIERRHKTYTPIHSVPIVGTVRIQTTMKCGVVESARGCFGIE